MNGLGDGGFGQDRGDGGFGSGGFGGSDANAGGSSGGFSGGDRGLGGFGGGDGGAGSVDRGTLGTPAQGGFTESTNPPVGDIPSMRELLTNTERFFDNFTSEKFGRNIAGLVGGVMLGGTFGAPGLAAGRALGQKGFDALSGLNTPGVGASSPNLAQNPNPGILPVPFANSTANTPQPNTQIQQLFPGLFGDREPKVFR